MTTPTSTTPAEFTPYAVGLMCASVCTSLSDEEATARLNRERPTGISSAWEVSDDEFFADGTSPNPCPCHDAPETHRHLLFNC